ncbi:DUF4145 domain-containing protein [Pantanalinema rosaneae CENA516]|uniref:DUF4145 domain-containing protein n=1 Tax=Pantanalinema rosaneae TaxID=1620701 RepID=UPI003D6F1697
MQNRKVSCEHCKTIVQAEVVSHYRRIDGDEYDDVYFSYYDYFFLKCLNCEHPILIQEWQLYKSYGMEAPELENASESMLFPASFIKVNSNLPVAIKEAYGEALLCLRAKAFTASVLMCRKTLEGICVDHGAKARDLKSSLQKMKDDGIIERRLFEWADALRISGNEAAHDVNISFSEMDAIDIIEFTKALIEYIYTFTDKFSAFLNRRNKS